jgi:hypothetical protein
VIFTCVRTPGNWHLHFDFYWGPHIHIFCPMINLKIIHLNATWLMNHKMWTKSTVDLNMSNWNCNKLQNLWWWLAVSSKSSLLTGHLNCLIHFPPLFMWLLRFSPLKLPANVYFQQRHI